MKKKLVCLLLSALMITGLLAGCGEKAEPAAAPEEPAKVETQPEKEEPKEEPAAEEAPAEKVAEPVTLTFWTPSWRQAAEEIVIADFMELHPEITIEVTYMSSDDIKSNTKIAASSNTLPDMWYNWGGCWADFYGENDLCLDLADYAEAHDWDQRFLSGAMDQCTYDGKLIGLPQNLIGLVMYYRADLFEQYDLEVPTTLEELEAVCDTLVANGIIPFASSGPALMRTFEVLLEYFGGAQEHDDLLLLKADWGESEAVTQSFAKMKEWMDKGYFAKTVLTDDASSANMLIFSGQAAMIMENPGMASSIVSNGYDTEDYAWFAFPSGTGRVSAYAKMCQFNANISEEKLEAAMLFWDYYYSEESLAKNDKIEQPTATIGVALPDSFKLAEGMLEVIDKNGSFSVMDLKVVPEVMDQYFAVSDGVILGSIAPEEAGAQIQAAVTSYLANQ